MRIRLNQQIRSYNDYANFRVYATAMYTLIQACRHVKTEGEGGPAGIGLQDSKGAYPAY